MMIADAGVGNTITIIISGLIVAYILYSFFRAKKQLNKPPSENVRILTDTNFDSVIKNGISLVDFWAAWCGPCRVQGPIIDEVADEIGDKYNICKVDVDKNHKITGKFGVQNIPTMIIFKNGKPIEKIVGIKHKAALIKMLQSQV